MPDDTGFHDVFVRDLLLGETTRVSISSLGVQANHNSGGQLLGPDISADGRLVVFNSSATNLIGNDTNSAEDIFVRDREPGPCAFPAAWVSYGSGWPGTLGIPAIVSQSNPVLCSSLEVAADNSSGSVTVGVLFAGVYIASLPTDRGGVLLVLPLVASPVRVPAAGLSLTAAIPCDDILCGVSFFVQVVEADPGASRGVSFTPGLELRLGVQ